MTWTCCRDTAVPSSVAGRSSLARAGADGTAACSTCTWQGRTRVPTEWPSGCPDPRMGVAEHVELTRDPGRQRQRRGWGSDCDSAGLICLRGLQCSDPDLQAPPAQQCGSWPDSKLIHAPPNVVRRLWLVHRLRVTRLNVQELQHVLWARQVPQGLETATTRRKELGQA